MTTATATWRIKGDYFESCNCDVICPCLFSPNPQMVSAPTQGACEVALMFHIDEGEFGGAKLDGLNAAIMARAPGPMGEGNWAVAVYLDERADDTQRAGLQAIFTGAAGGPVAAIAPLIGNVLGVKAVPITFAVDGLRRSAAIPSVLDMSVKAIPSGVPDREMWVTNASPFAETVSFAVGDGANTWNDYGMSWDNSGKNGHYAPIAWSA